MLIKIALLHLYVVCAVTSADVTTKFVKVLNHINKPNGNGLVYSYPTKNGGDVGKQARVPVDDGRSNYGDLIHNNRVDGDNVLARDIAINPVSSSDQYFQWTANFPGRTISQVRFLNIGRQRAYTSYIGTRPGSGYAEAEVQVAAGKEVRLLVEVYGY